jgi:hypothetical protein
MHVESPSHAEVMSQQSIPCLMLKAAASDHITCMTNM